MAPPKAMEPTFRGFVDTTHDALVLLEACNQQQCDRVTRRLQEKERSEITSGSVYVFDENESRIKRWTDGRMWSPSRILGNFLVYRELDKRTVDEESINSAALSRAEEERLYGGTTDESNPRSGRTRERSLVGSLTSSFKFKKNGLVKKTISNGTLHLVCYYCVDDVLEGRLRTPSSLPELLAFSISASLLDPSIFRVPPKIDYLPNGTPVFVAERDENAPPRPSTARSSFASSSSMISPIDTSLSNTSADYFSFTTDGPSSANSSVSSGEMRNGSAGSESYISPRLSLNSSASARIHTVSGGPARSNSSRVRHNPYGPRGSANDQLLAPGYESRYDQPRYSDSYSASQPFQRSPMHLNNELPPISPASSTFAYNPPPPANEPNFSTMAEYDFPPPRNNSIAINRPYTSYDTLTTGNSHHATDFMRSSSSSGPSRERSSTGPSMGFPRLTQSSNQTWTPDCGMLLGAPPSLENVPETMSYNQSNYTNDRIALQQQYGMYNSHSARQNYTPPFFTSSPAPSHVVVPQQARPVSPRTAAPPTSPFFYNSPGPTESPIPQPIPYPSDPYYTQYAPSRTAEQPQPPRMVQPIPVYSQQHRQRQPQRLEQEVESNSPYMTHSSVPVWLQQQQHAVSR